MEFDAVLLSRFQFAWVVAFHILLPAFTVGLSCFIATLEFNWWITKRDVYRRLSAFWLKIFAVSFGMGVVSGIVMPFQFGTNWSRFSDIAANVIGPLMGYEVITAFFLEAAFLGVLLFGRKLVPQWAHVMSAIFVAAGTVISSFWILAVNSWMQTPQGHRILPDGRFEVVSFFDVIFTPSFPYRLGHTVSAFLVTAAFVILGVGAMYVLQRRALEESRVMLKMSLIFLVIMVPVQMVIGDMHGLNTLKHQPAKIAAMEGLWETGSRVPANLFAIPDQDAEMNHFEIAIPVLGSIYLTHDPNGTVQGLKAFPREDRPPVAVVFFAFRIMVGIALLMFALVLSGIVLFARGRLEQSRAWLRCATLGMPLGFIAVIAGWTTTEAGRQPWTIYGLLRTKDSVTPSLTAANVGLSWLLYVLAYLVIFGAGFTLLRRLVRVGPSETTQAHEGDQLEPEKRAARPLSALSNKAVAASAAKGTEPPPRA
ncbi:MULTISPECIES: cytochrome ubiquinol oxidase subunit I [unclassified Caballeronia]|uniref:cytochrome ubiquinol oxidase subunit I n=1 Tax=unclassified Caballeronia TaxID=2646786 RepID=UPI00285F0CEB|nr:MULTISPECIES: cytochrome ubiquinol oxidase subunit I [unclassified Caballeronia]MDR5751022.1 cytochrome ubiquinol oxidase subunit I [Caballeronia sp. LZ024]MDR5844843.1 cytochrome ubiquinol oxidase subunit I [Caballeronia sp. LZ031]